MNVDINIEHLFISLNIMKVFFIIDHSILKIKYKIWICIQFNTDKY